MFINELWKTPVWEEPDANKGGGTDDVGEDGAPAEPSDTGGEAGDKKSGEGDDSKKSAISEAGEDDAEDDDGAAAGDDAGEVEPVLAESITFPDGVEADAELLTPFLEIINNGELSRADLAQKIVDLQIQSMQRATDAADEAGQTLFDDTQTQWQADMKAMPEIGGANLDISLAQIKSGLKAAGADKATFAALDVTGAGNHPAIFKVLHTLTKSFTEGSHVSGDPAKDKLSQADKMFGGSQT